MHILPLFFIIKVFDKKLLTYKSVCLLDKLIQAELRLEHKYYLRFLKNIIAKLPFKNVLPIATFIVKYLVIVIGIIQDSKYFPG